ncbi:thiopeptide-type bacteriocin biosynthesis protein [Parabacteroides pacaensis]|uniref:thiopeptide-type bacteriocin biosynthesis protein n=1 Tax=Parabacteroides pacaensis TaxID=2086575 RepID=UPI00131B5925|nr:thiopeptide-type bacteriocin biosynthesis protein [Parabacteroides pacaensis]
MEKIQRTFIPGSRWLYFKVYTGVKTADKILINNISSVIKRMKRLGILEKWFFIRYNDPDFHLRVRFLVKDEKHIGEAIHLFYKQCSSLMEKKRIWKLQLETYNRELERYNSKLMEDAESIFYLDSECILSLLSLLEKYGNENYRWMVSLKMIDGLLSDFCFSLERKQELLALISDSFKAEFGFNKYNSKQFNSKYRENKSLIERVLKESTEDEKMVALSSVIRKRDRKLILLASGINHKLKCDHQEKNIEALLSSYIHMTMNRLFRSKNRVHELLLYDFLARYYTSEIAREKYKSLPEINLNTVDI